MSRTGARRRRLVALALSAFPVLWLAACSSGSTTSAPPPTIPATVIPPATTTTLEFTTLTSAPNISVAPPACRLSVQGSTAPGATLTVVLTTRLPLASTTVDYRFGTTTRSFGMRTSGSGVASHALIVPKQAAGTTVTVTATLAQTHATCSTGFSVP